ncbi:ATP-grasp domain-containing protein [Paenibacillus thermotolerans]|uniref:ATP-grasp domain-containing protein n=1 Tax=Paenibacillus thermotolerans TaxID=3027807 RepID=UPI00236817E9|nr:MULTISPECIES: RimK family alpha-L-glutamate ligase [unclassified Paenibacillus]
MNADGWLIYNREDAEKNRSYISWMLEEAESLNADLRLLLKEQLSFGVRSGKLFVAYLGKPVDVPKFAIVRNIDELFTEQLESMGVKVYNNSFVSKIANNKAATYQYLAQHRIPVPDTLFIRKKEFNPAALGDFAFPMILKDVAGRGGSQVYKVDGPEELTQLIDRLQEGAFVLQQMMKPGKDVRVFVVGTKIIAAIVRESKQDFRANYSLGGSSSVYRLSNEETELVNRIIGLFSFGMAGIDFMFDDNDRLVFNEIEDVVGSRTLSLNTDINIVREYLQFILDDSRLV